MRVLALVVAGADDAKPAYWSPGPDPGELDRADWLTRKVSQMRARIDERSGGLGPRLGRLFAKLERLAPADEPLLRDLRAADELLILHPNASARVPARKRWRRYLRGRGRASFVGMVLNGLLTPLATLLMILPGPNVVGFWFAYRAIGRFLAWRGVAGALRRDRKTRFEAESALDRPLGDDQAVAELAQALNLPAEPLNEFVARIRPAPK